MLFYLLRAAFIQLALAWGCYGLLRLSTTGTDNRRVFGNLTALVLGVLVFLFAGNANNLIILAQMLLLALIGVLCLRVKVRLRVFIAWSLVGLTGMIAVVAIRDSVARNEVREQYAFESLAERLAYEARPAVATNDGEDRAATTRQLPGATQQRLAIFEDTLSSARRFGTELRGRSLKLLHASQVEQFVNSEGFGVGRMRNPSLHYLKPEERPPLLTQKDGYRQPRKPYRPDQSNEVEPDAEIAAAPLDREVLDGIHVFAALDFVNRDGFGYVKYRDQVAGFQSHAFSRHPDIYKIQDDQHRWTIHKVELVSLLKHEVPKVYVSDRLPNMNDLKQAAVRPLDQFEQQALVKLRNGDDVIAEQSAGRLRMFGSLRAARKCTECHTVSRGSLLGAFSYELRREMPATPGEKPVTRPSA